MALAEMAAGCARRYAEWVDVSLFADAAFVRTINAMLASADHGLRGGGCDFLAALAHKGMDHGAKVGLIARLDLVNVSRRVLNGSLNGANNVRMATTTTRRRARVRLRRWRRRSAASSYRASARRRRRTRAPRRTNRTRHPRPRTPATSAARMVDELMPACRRRALFASRIDDDGDRTPRHRVRKQAQGRARREVDAGVERGERGGTLRGVARSRDSSVVVSGRPSSASISATVSLFSISNDVFF